MRLVLASLLALSLASAARAAPVPYRQAQIARLIRDLGSDSPKAREEATRALLHFGPAAVPALRAALRKGPAAETARQIKGILQTINPVFEGHSNGWHWVYADLAQGQTFQSVGTTVRHVKLRVARMNRNQPAAALVVEVRDAGLKKVYLRGHIPAADSTLEFRWHGVQLEHVADLKEGGHYYLIFHSRGAAAQACWAVNAIYKDVYPHGRASQRATEDFFFSIGFSNQRTLRVGPDGEDTPQKLPFNSGNRGGTGGGNGKLGLAGHGELPAGEVVAAPKVRPRR